MLAAPGKGGGGGPEDNADPIISPTPCVIWKRQQKQKFTINIIGSARWYIEAEFLFFPEDISYSKNAFLNT